MVRAFAYALYTVGPMGADETVVDSPTRWVAKHISEYVESAGANGHS